MDDQQLLDWFINNVKLEVDNYIFGKTADIHLKVKRPNLDIWVTISTIEIDMDLPPSP